MNPALLKSVEHFLGVTTILIMSYIVGYVFMTFNKKIQENIYSKTFSQITSGFFLLIFFTALYHANGITSLWVIPIYMVSLYQPFSKPEFHFDVKKTITAFAIILVFAVCFLCLSNYMLNYDNAQKTVIYCDFTFYVDLSNFMMLKGVEGCQIHPLFKQAFNQPPYHYIDLWAFALIKDATSLNPKDVYYSVYFVVFAVLSTFGVFAFITQRTSSLKIYIIILISIISIFYCSVFPFRDGGWDWNLYFAPKVAPLVLWVIFAYVNTNNIRAFLSIGSLVCFFNVLITPVWAVLVLLEVFKGCRQDKIITLIKGYIPLILSSIFFITFYFYLYIPAGNEANYNIEKNDFSIAAYLLEYLRLVFRVNIIRFIFFNSLLLFWILIAWYYNKKKIPNNIVLILIAQIISFVIACVFHFFDDHYQISGLAISVLMPILIIESALFFNDTNYKILTGFVITSVILTGLNFYSRKSNEFHQHFSQKTLNEIQFKKIFNNDSLNMAMHYVNSPLRLPHINYESNRAIGTVVDNLFMIAINTTTVFDSIYQPDYIGIYKNSPIYRIRKKLNFPHDSVLCDELINNHKFKYFIAARDYPEWVESRFKNKYYSKEENLTILYNPN